MATGKIVSAWKDESNAYLAVRVAEGGAMGNVEYVASTPLEEEVDKVKTVKPNAQLKTELVAAVKAQRDKQVGGKAAVPISGDVTL
jgi:hypothetical protein